MWDADTSDNLTRIELFEAVVQFHFHWDHQIEFGLVLQKTKYHTKLLTLPETNMAPENGWLEDEFPFGMACFQVLC